MLKLNYIVVNASMEFFKCLICFQRTMYKDCTIYYLHILVETNYRKKVPVETMISIIKSSRFYLDILVQTGISSFQNETPLSKYTSFLEVIIDDSTSKLGIMYMRHCIVVVISVILNVTLRWHGVHNM